MKENLEPKKDDRLTSLLTQWTVRVPLPPRFQERVWQRIARGEAPPKATVWARFSFLIEVFLPRPGVAFAYVTSLLVIGVLVGSIAAQLKTINLETALSMRYVRSVAPYVVELTQP